MEPVVPDLGAVNDANTRYLHTLDAMDPEAIGEPSLLPGWTRAHVIAHLALNAIGMTRAVEGLVRGDRVPMYDGDAARDAEVDEYAGRSYADLRTLTLDATGRLRDALESITPEHHDDHIERTPGGRRVPVAELPPARTRELEIHHADLGLDYTAEDWPADFARYLLLLAAWDRGTELDLQLNAVSGMVAVGDGTGPVVAGSDAALAWWLVGRGNGDGLTGQVPRLGPWQRRTAEK